MGRGGTFPDLGTGAVAILHCVLGLYQLFRFLNHLASESSDALSGRESCGEGPGTVCCGHRLGVPPPPLLRGVGLGKPLCPFGPQFTNLQKRAIKLLLNSCKEWVSDRALGTEEELITPNECWKGQSQKRTLAQCFSPRRCHDIWGHCRQLCGAGPLTFMAQSLTLGNEK